METFVTSENLLQTLFEESNKNTADAQAVVSGLSEAQLNWSPSPEKWSIAQCLEHLAAASRGFNPFFIDALARGQRRFPAPSPPAYHPSFMGRLLIKYVEPQSPRKLRAPKIFRPSISNVQNALDNFLQQQKIFIEFVRKTEGIDYNKTRLRSPVTPLIRYTLADAYVITVSHEQRHLQQARRVRETPGFPGNAN